MQIIAHLFAVCPDSDRAVVVEGHDRLGEEPYRLKEVVYADRHEHIQLKIALRCSHSDGNVVAHDLNGNHRHLFALSGVDLAGHYRRTRFVLRDENLAETVARSGCQPSYVVCDLHHVGGKSLKRTVSKHQLVL